MHHTIGYDRPTVQKSNTRKPRPRYRSSTKPAPNVSKEAINGTLLYYARAVDPTMLRALNVIFSRQATPTQQMVNKCLHLLDYTATYPNADLRYHASGMVLHVDTDAAYLVLPKARSVIAGHYFLSDNPPPPPTKPNPKPNGPIHTECHGTIRWQECSQRVAHGRQE
jgi:hypothetical protein